MIKICIWMNAPSHHQSAFFAALKDHDKIDLEVRYFNVASKERSLEGWKTEHMYMPYEISLSGLNSPEEMLATLDDALERVHIISRSFCPELVNFMCKCEMNWCHWSERPGFRLMRFLGYNLTLFNIIEPLMLTTKRLAGRQIDRHALLAFCQGLKAAASYRFMGVSESKIDVLYYALNSLNAEEPLTEITSFANGRKVFLCAASLYKGKGIDLLLKAFAQLMNNDWCLAFCGHDKEKGKYQKMAQELGIDSQVLFIGVIPAEQIGSVYAASDVFVLPSRWDGWGAVLNEAASLGLPLIASDMCGAAWHLIDEGKNGFRVKAGNVQALAEAMQKYIDSADLAGQHGEASRELFKEFTPQRNVERLVKAIDKVK